MIVIGFGHKARQGKNTAAAAMHNALPLEAESRLYAFGDALKLEVMVACGKYGGQFQLIQAFQDEGLMPGWVEVEEGKPRSLLQWWGTDFRRKHDPEYWTKRLHKTLVAHSPEYAFVTDVRFPNEAEFIHRLGGVLVKVERDGPPDVQVNPHPSEAALNGYTGWDYTIRASDKAELIRKSEALLGQIVGRFESDTGKRLRSG